MVSLTAIETPNKDTLLDLSDTNTTSVTLDNLLNLLKLGPDSYLEDVKMLLTGGGGGGGGGVGAVVKSNKTPQKPLVKFLVCDLPHPTLVSRFLLSMFELAAICDTLICICFTWNEGASSGASLSEWAAA